MSGAQFCWSSLRLPLGWGLAYAWCPLVIKEFANSGHLDAIAVCLTTASLCCAAKLYRGPKDTAFRWAGAAAVLLGLSVGAKLYAIVLLPLMACVTARQAGLGKGVLFGVTATLISVACLAPMFWPPHHDGVAREAEGALARRADGENAGTAPGQTLPDESESRSGLAAFLSRWEMNDFLFLIVVENLQPVDAVPDQPQPWFAVVPNAWRSGVVRPIASGMSIELDRAAFMLARAVTAALLLGIIAILLGWVARDEGLPRFLEAAFLTLAWFWLLAPTQNPWYWTWALPLIPFARGRAWLALSGLVILYYLRFWLIYHRPEPGVLGTRYDGQYFFDFVMTWIEFGPWLAWLTMAALARRLKKTHRRRCPSSGSVPELTEKSALAG